MKTAVFVLALLASLSAQAESFYPNSVNGRLYVQNRLAQVQPRYEPRFEYYGWQHSAPHSHRYHGQGRGYQREYRSNHGYRQADRNCCCQERQGWYVRR